jgi:Carboxypeptidase regulatory-like domain
LIKAPKTVYKKSQILRNEYKSESIIYKAQRGGESGNMLKKVVIVSLSLLIFVSNGFGQLLFGLNLLGQSGDTGTLEKMIVANGSVTMDLNQLNGNRSSDKEPQSSVLRFEAERDSFFTALVFNDELRGPQPGSMGIIPQNSANLPAKLSASYQQLVIETTPWGEPYDLVVRDRKTGFIFFNIEGEIFDYDSSQHLLSVEMGRLLISKEFAAELGRPSEVGAVVGKISISATMRPIEITKYDNGEVKSNVLPAINNQNPLLISGPDVVVGDLSGLAQFGSSSGTQVGLAVGTDSCNFGNVDLDWFALPSNNHPVIPQNLYRMSGGANNDERFEQIGQSSVKHAFTALTNNICSLGCNGVGGTRLGSGCSDPYSASLNAGPNLGSRAWINPFTGAYPRGDSADNPNNHTGHTHTGPSHRMLTEINDLNTSLNVGATYYAESQYVTPHEYVWCQANPTQCNMNNNVSYRKYSVTGTASPFSFSPVAATVRSKAAVTAWTGATLVDFNPDPRNDGIGTIAYKVTNPSAGVWHYEYAIYNQNLDRAIQSFGIPMAAGVTVSNVGFHEPPQQPGNAGFSSAPWTQTQASGMMTFSSETLAQNPNANAIRWGTLYNFRFDSNRPPQTTNATIGFLKTGSPITVQIQSPSIPSVAVSVSGRVATSTGRAIGNARVTITDSSGNSRTVRTTSFGYYRFDNVASAATYTITVVSRRYTFTSRTLTINDNLADVNFSAAPTN